MALIQALPEDVVLSQPYSPYRHAAQLRLAGESLARARAEAAFARSYPAYAATTMVDQMRTHAYSRLDRLGHVYLDYSGGSLFAEAQLQEHMALLNAHVFGNPHSTNPTSQAMTQLVDQARSVTLAHLNASPDEYAVIFTNNASGALKLVGEAYPFRPNGQLLLSSDNHNSVNGIREFARAKGAQHSYAPLYPDDLRLDEGRLEALLGRAQPGSHRLFAYPAQSNFSGVRHSLEWIGRAQEQGWDVLLDAAAFLPTNRLDLSRWRPDFVALSFYKMFGYPTGVGALVARRGALEKLRRPWFAGGTVTLASVLGDGHYLDPNEAGFEDGTVNYLSIPAVTSGLHHLDTIGVDTIHTRVQCLTGWLLDSLRALCHGNGTPLIAVHGPTDTQMRGGTLALTFHDHTGQPIDYRRIEHHANAAQISLRTGCFCNPGASEYAHRLTGAMLAPCFGADRPITREQYQQALGGNLPGAVRVSLGIASNFADVYAFVQFAHSYLS